MGPHATKVLQITPYPGETWPEEQTRYVISDIGGGQRVLGFWVLRAPASVLRMEWCEGDQTTPGGGPVDHSRGVGPVLAAPESVTDSETLPLTHPVV